MTKEQWDVNFVRPLLAQTKEHPQQFIYFLAHHARNNPELIPYLADALQDLGNWYGEHAAALEAECRKRGLNVLPIGTRGDGA